jgi:NRAMP (natural resistance-associated macrophage protein)-like metal ion transporter
LCEIAIAACDLAEVIGSAIALNLLFGLPLAWGVCLTALDVLAVLYLQQKGFRYIEAFVIALIRHHRHMLRDRDYSLPAQSVRRPGGICPAG